MPFEWLRKPLDAPVGELFARGRRSRAIEQIRSQLQGQIAPSVELRLELVDLLIGAGRVGEAVPVLLGLADEFARDGFVAKSVAALKRIERMEPGRADVESRLASLVHQQHESVPLLEPGESKPPAGSQPAVSEVDLDLGTKAKASSARGVKGAPPPVRAAFQRFLADRAAPEARAADGAGSAPQPDPVVEAEPGPAEAMTDAAFDEELITLAADVVQRAPGPGSDERLRLVAIAERLLACDLFAGVPEEELLAAVRALRLEIVDPGEVILAEGEAGEGLYIVVSGAVKVFIRNPSGRNVPIARLSEGQYFGEIASLSGRPRNATVTAAARTELLFLDAPTLREMSGRLPRLARRLEDVCVERVSSPDAAAVRNVALADAAVRARAAEALRRHFGEGRWEPRVRLKLAEALLRTGKEEEALALLAALADDLLQEGFPEKAVAVLKKIEFLRNRHVEVVNLAPLPVLDLDTDAPAPAAPARPEQDAPFQSWLLDMLRERVKRSAVRAPTPAATPGPPPAASGSIRTYEPGLRASPLLQGLSDDEQLALLHGLDLVSAQPGDILVNQGERGDSLYILASGAVRVYVGSADGKPSLVCELGEGAFFGEMAAVRDEPRSATVVASEPSEFLRLDRPGLEAISSRHPRVRSLLEDYCARRGAKRVN